MASMSKQASWFDSMEKLTYQPFNLAKERSTAAMVL